jgi:4-hydroxy-tetrahydrodipicolinate synthase
MSSLDWTGVMPAVTTPFHADRTIDEAFFRKHVAWMAGHGCTAIVVAGSLGEGATLSFEEKEQLCRAAVESAGVPVVLGVSALSTAEAVAQAKMAARVGCEGLMVLPPYVYKGDWRETKAHFAAVITATELSCMLYNNPIAYGTDALPEQIEELASEFPNLHAVKESSADVRRLAAIQALIGDRLKLCVGVDDVIVEGIAAGAVGWVAGLVNAFPAESVRLFNEAKAGGYPAVKDLYSWFLPLLRLDVVPKFVQLIKLAQQEVGMGSEVVRAPRHEIVGEERAATLTLIRNAVSHPV